MPSIKRVRYCKYINAKPLFKALKKDIFEKHVQYVTITY